MSVITPTMQPLARNKTFQPEREPLRRSTTLRLDSDKVHGPVSFLYPTRARFTQVQPSIPEDDVPTAALPSPPAAPDPGSTLPGRPTGLKTPQPALTYQWTSRNARKGRHTFLVNEREVESTGLIPPQPTNSLGHFLHIVRLMLTTLPLWDISFTVAILFVIGSAVWVLNGTFTLLPFTNPESKFPGMAIYGGGITAFIGGVLFLIGGIFMILEAINENRQGYFG